MKDIVYLRSQYLDYQVNYIFKINVEVQWGIWDQRWSSVMYFKPVLRYKAKQRNVYLRPKYLKYQVSCILVVRCKAANTFWSISIYPNHEVRSIFESLIRKTLGQSCIWEQRWDIKPSIFFHSPESWSAIHIWKTNCIAIILLDRCMVTVADKCWNIKTQIHFNLPKTWIPMDIWEISCIAIDLLQLLRSSKV